MTPPDGPRPRVKVWLEAADGTGFGTGFVAILQAVERTGSIKSAAAELGRSYRHVWDRIQRAERALGRPLVESQVGGQGARRSRLTDAGRGLVADFLALRGRMIDVMEEFAARRDRARGEDASCKND